MIISNVDHSDTACANDHDHDDGDGAEGVQVEEEEEERLRSLLMINSAQPQEGSLKPNPTRGDYRDVRDVFENDDGDGGPDNHAIESTTIGGGGPSEEHIADDAPSSLTSSKSPPRSFSSPREFRMAARTGQFTGPTNGICPGRTQCNLVVLEERRAFDFLLFCQRNKKACPLIEVCDVGSHAVSDDVATGGCDLRTDLPKYCVYRDGKLEREVEDATPYWPERAVAFLIGCSFSYDGALLDAGIPLRSAEQNKNVPMYRTNIPCRPAGDLRGNVVVSMKPIKAIDVAKEVEITSQYPHAHGAPLCVGRPSAIGIENLDAPEWGDPVEVMEDEVPVFHACGITPQAVLMESGVGFAITHCPGHMFVTDLPSDMVI